MIEPIRWLRTLQFVATDACVREDECVRAPLLFVYNILKSEYKCMWVASTKGARDGACEKSREISVCVGKRERDDMCRCNPCEKKD